MRLTRRTKLIAGTACLLAGIAGLTYVDTARATVTTPAAATSITTTTNYGSGAWAGPSTAITRSGDPATADVLIVGDSITNRCYPALRTALAPRTLAVVAQSGQNTAGLATLLLALPKVPAHVVMAAGTNDVFNPPAVAAQVGRVSAWASDNAVDLRWVDTYVGRPTYAVADARNSGWVNGQVYASAQRVIGWQPALGAAVGRGRALTYYLQDGVHPWAAAGTGHGDGCAFWAAIVKGGLS
jgi:hypothetical protein